MSNTISSSASPAGPPAASLPAYLVRHPGWALAVLCAAQFIVILDTSIVGIALLGAAWIPMWFFLNMFLQQVLELDALESGLALLPMTLAIMVLMVAATEKIVGRIGPKSSLVYGLALLALALVLFARIPADGNLVSDALPASLIAAFGMALAYVPSVIVSTSGARPEEGGLASGLVNTTYQVGSALGLAVMVAVAHSAEAPGSTPGAGFSAAFIGAAIVASLAVVVAALFLRGAGSEASVPAPGA
jgi:MFS family permease